MLAIQAMRDARVVVDLVEDPISIILQGRGEDDYLVELRELREEPGHTRSHKVEHISLKLM
jgi:hypothetical protein